ncbi:hypothetical protein RFY44_05945 [Acinetobacter bereziniae]|uniref:hypothetical protein n=1 Tax=Acinetobacter bereziniae TaxID=106648 RepID=UPI0012503B44|nr:hypothetical protein [Acinetobacter bereziniae]MDQ9818422.1 hypothetical protein [Acinetobacter bereziniae]
MVAPIPKTKLDEVAGIIYNDTDNIYLSEFEAARLIRMTKEGDELEPLRAKKHRMVIHYLAGNYSEAKKELKTLIPYTKENLDLFIQVTAIALRIGAFKEVTLAANTIDINKILTTNNPDRLSIISDFGAPFYLLGDFDMGIKNIERIEKALFTENNENLKGKLDRSKLLRDIYLKLGLNNDKVQNLTALVESVIHQNKVRVLGAFISTPEEEMLIDLGVSAPIDAIIKLNDELFELAYENNLMEELNALSINFSPIDVEQLKYAII